MEHKGTVFNIQHFSIHDGPGIRTVVFLKGCPLRCRWCANPESQRNHPEMGWTKADCIGCGCCLRQLPELECRFEEDSLFWNTEKPVDVENFRKVCPAEAFHVIGKYCSVSEIMEEVEKDRTFYQSSGGGITISGGEPLMQPAFVSELLKEAGKKGLHRAVETCGYANWEVYQSIIGQVDYLLTDVKCMDEAVHISNTGKSNRRILENLKRARTTFPSLPILVRTPVIPGVNDSEEEIGRIVSFVRELRANYELLKYHRYGFPKYVSLNRSYPMGDVELSEERFQKLEAFVLQELHKTGYDPVQG